MQVMCIPLMIAAVLTLSGVTEGQTDFRRSDPALLGTTGRPQLIEFYHPT
jgi:hypothetical protein